MFVDTTQDNITEICKHLSVKDLYNLRRTHPVFSNVDFSSRAHTQVISAVNHKLAEIFKDRVGEFKSLLADHNGHISGSFIIQTILEETWANSDIDVYIASTVCNSIEYTKLEDFLYEVGEFSDYENTTTYGDDVSTQEYKIGWIREYSVSNHKIQIMHVSTDDILGNIHSTFDFDVCKNTYSISQDGTETVYIYDLEGILSKTFDFKIGFRGGSSIERAIKYEDRGFKINYANVDYLDFLNRCVSKFMFTTVLHVNRLDEVRTQVTETRWSKKELTYSCFKITHRNRTDRLWPNKRHMSIEGDMLYMNDELREFNHFHESNYDTFSNKFACNRSNCILKLIGNDRSHVHYITFEGDRIMVLID